VTPKAVFIGVNQHVDPKIPELSGACGDATALWALFTDTFPGMTGRLLTDRYAAHAAVTHAVLELLSSAGTEDVIVISFAGHGSPDGRLMLFDTSVTALAETTLSMSDLAQAFRSTKARAVLCILDCCFSGRAPARILEVGALPEMPLRSPRFKARAGLF